MKNLFKYIGMMILLITTVACDQRKDDPTKPTGTAFRQAAAHAASVPVTLTPPSTAQQTADHSVSLVANKLHFTLPADMTDKSDQINVPSNTVHVYADKTGQRVLIVLESEASKDSLEMLSQRMKQQQSERDPQLQVAKSQSITIDNHPLWQLDSIISAAGQTSWSTVLLTNIQEKLVTLQITLPDTQQPEQVQQKVDEIIKTIHITP